MSEDTKKTTDLDDLLSLEDLPKLKICHAWEEGFVVIQEGSYYLYALDPGAALALKTHRLFEKVSGPCEERPDLIKKLRADLDNYLDENS